jgi:hypothetical protein
MSKIARTGLYVNVAGLALILIGIVYAQRPPEVDPTGAAYLRVNINPTDVPPEVNINPNQSVPRIRVTELPEIRIPAMGCQNRRNYQTGIGRAITGPLMVTYLHLPAQQTRVTLVDGGGSHSLNLGQAGQITTAVYLEANQRLEFDSDIMFSGCRPE